MWVAQLQLLQGSCAEGVEWAWDFKLVHDVAVIVSPCERELKTLEEPALTPRCKLVQLGSEDSWYSFVNKYVYKYGTD